MNQQTRHGRENPSMRISSVFSTSTLTVALAAALCAACAAPSFAQSSDSARVVIKAAGLVDPALGTTRRNVVVIVQGSHIADVIPAARYSQRASDRLIDLGSATLLPGLIDGHVHLTIGGAPRTNASSIVRAGFNHGSRPRRCLPKRAGHS